MLSRIDYDRIALVLVALDKQLARDLLRMAKKARPVKPGLVLLAASLQDAINSTTLSRDEAAAMAMMQEALGVGRERAAAKSRAKPTS